MSSKSSRADRRYLSAMDSTRIRKSTYGSVRLRSTSDASPKQTVHTSRRRAVPPECKTAKQLTESSTVTARVNSATGGTCRRRKPGRR
ncbi:UNVERIFIED_CONTAM: hypothetical protein PYX00_003976 [Menopon gallinae]|uniref:Uncharacterized protein n=1 Tax=Menopon gallinae TaxID=328185 RepID=A0AAW2I3K4_9NEOP